MIIHTMRTKGPSGSAWDTALQHDDNAPIFVILAVTDGENIKNLIVLVYILNFIYNYSNFYYNLTYSSVCDQKRGASCM